MMGREKLKEMADAGLQEAGNFSAEVHLSSSRYELTRFAEGQIHQNISMDGINVTACIYDGRKSARVQLSAPKPDRVRQAVQKAKDKLKYATEGPERPMPKPHQGFCSESPPGFDEKMLTEGTQWRTDTVKQVVEEVEDRGPDVYGRAITEATELLTVNTEGLVSYAPRTRCDLSVSTIRDTGYGYSQRHACALDDIDVEEAAQEAAVGCNRARDPQDLVPADYPVVLLPYAVADIMSFIGRLGADSQAVQEGRSFMSDNLGQQVVSDKISLWDDGFEPRGRPIPFDGEGVKKQPVTIIEDGVTISPVYNQITGAEGGVPSTGHSPVGSSFGARGGSNRAIPQNLFVGEGSDTVADMIEGTDVGVLVTSFHYTRAVEPSEVVVTGMTRNGTFLIKNGEVVHPIKNLRFTDSYLRILNHVTHVGSESMNCGGGIGSIRVPALRLESLRFTEKTDF